MEERFFTVTNSDRGFFYYHLTDKNPRTNNFALHTHKNWYELLFVLRGDCEFRAEGNIYALERGSVAITHPNELHRVMHLSDAPYERVVVNLTPEFFTQNNCTEYTDAFLSRNLGESNVITPVGIADAMNRLESYGGSVAVTQAVLIEILHLLNTTVEQLHEKGVAQKHLRDIILYINSHISEDLSLDTLCAQFFINKSYLCRLFRSKTGLTINKYITIKRLAEAKRLADDGATLTDAAMGAGFGSYSAFYKMYMREKGSAPSRDI